MRQNTCYKAKPIPIKYMFNSLHGVTYAICPWKIAYKELINESGHLYCVHFYITPEQDVCISYQNNIHLKQIFLKYKNNMCYVFLQGKRSSLSQRAFFI